MSGGGGLKMKVINYCLDYPVRVYIGGGFLLYGIRKYATMEAYGRYFGKFDY